MSPEEVVRAIALHPEPVVAAKDVNDKLGLSTDGARERLKRLVDEGKLDSKHVGRSGLVFWLRDDGRELLNETFDGC